MKLKKNIVTQNIGNELIVLDLDGNVYFSVNETGRFILESLLNHLSPEQTAKAAESIFQVSYDEILNDVHTFIDTLKNEQLLEDTTNQP
ncbi:MAG: PqqD family protein [Proteobacteria bacterium]|jgi:hypothetical protein|nr:PqqD family protein [Pseudomonadota bacterium]